MLFKPHKFVLTTRRWANHLLVRLLFSNCWNIHAEIRRRFFPRRCCVYLFFTAASTHEVFFITLRRIFFLKKATKNAGQRSLKNVKSKTRSWNMFKHKSDIIIYLFFIFFSPRCIFLLSFSSTVKTLVTFVVVKSLLKHIQNNTTEKTWQVDMPLCIKNDYWHRKAKRKMKCWHGGWSVVGPICSIQRASFKCVNSSDTAHFTKSLFKHNKVKLKNWTKIFSISRHLVLVLVTVGISCWWWRFLKAKICHVDGARLTFSYPTSSPFR